VEAKQKSCCHIHALNKILLFKINVFITITGSITLLVDY